MTKQVTMTNEVAKILKEEGGKPEIVVSKPGTIVKEEWISLAKTLGTLIVSAVVTAVLRFALDQITQIQTSGELEMALFASLTLVLKATLKAVETTKYVR